MRPTASSTASSPTRRPLHERTSSEADTNKEEPRSTLRVVTAREDSDVPSGEPLPTKPEHILSPSSVRESSITPVAGTPDVSTVTRSSATAEHSAADLWDLPYVSDAENRTSHLWEGSSRSTFPELTPSNPPDLGLHRLNENSESSDEDDKPVLPPNASTIKPIVSEPPSPNDSAPGPSGFQETTTSSDSSPNVVPIGPPSSPNLVALDSSSLNFIPIGTPSSNSGSATRSNSVKSLNSMGTVVRHVGASPWIHSSPEYSSSRSRSQSTRSDQPVASIKSGSGASRGHSHSASGTGSSRSAVSGSDGHANTDSGVFIQYPVLRGPSLSSLRAESSRFPIAGSSMQTSVSGRSLRAHSRSLTTVPSQRSAERDTYTAPASIPELESIGSLSPPAAALTKQESSLWSATDSEKGERVDSLATLPPAVTRPGNPAIPSDSSSGSGSNSLNSAKRPGTGSSHILNLVPTWARAYYQSDGNAINYALSLVETGRPSSSRSNMSNTAGYAQTTVNQPRTPAHDTTDSVSERTASDPKDPRSHWVRGPELAGGSRPGTSRSQVRESWSPHLFPDRNAMQHKKSTWSPVSMDSFAEATFGRRNIQVYLFCLGFIFPFGR